MEKITNTLKDLGFTVEKLDDFGFSFQYEGINFLYMPNDDDEDFLNIAVPALVEKSDITEEQYNALQIDVNSTLKYVKSYTLGESLWLFYERELFGGEDMEELITRMILRLEAATYYVKHALTADDVKANAEEGENNDKE